MKRMKEVILIAAAVLFSASFTATSYAQQPAAGPNKIQRSAPVTNTPAIKPLQQPLMLQGSMPPVFCASTVSTINDVIKLAQTDVPKVVQLYTNQGDMGFPGTSENVAGIYRSYVQDCCSPNKSFSVQDQKNAGCADSDNVKLCMEKVIKHCVSQYPHRNSLKAMLANSRDKANKVIFKTKQLHDSINQLYDLIP